MEHEIFLLILVSILCISAMGIIFCIVLHVIFRKKRINSFEIKHFIIDKENGIVKVFVPRNLSKVSTISILSFYRYFEENSSSALYDQPDKIETFVNNYFNESYNGKDYFEVNALKNLKTLNYYRGVFEVTKINREKGIMHANLYYFKNLPTINKKERFNGKQEKLEKAYPSKEGIKDLNRVFQSKDTPRGASFMFTISAKYRLNALKTERYVYWTLFDILAKYNKRYDKIIYPTNDNELSFVVHNFKFSTTQTCLKYITKIEEDFNMFLSCNDLLDQYGLYISVFEHQSNIRDYGAIIKNLYNFVQYAISENRNHLFYDSKLPTNLRLDENTKRETSWIIEKNLFIYKYRPIFDTQKLDMYGWICSISIEPGMFDDIYELKLYAKALNRLTDLMRINLKTITNNASNELGSYSRESRKLFISVQTKDVESILKLQVLLSNVDDVDLIFIFDELDLRNNYNNENLLRMILDLKKYNDVAMAIKTHEQVIPNEIYAEFNYFMFNSPSLKDNKDIGHASFVLKKSIEKTLKYRKDIILTDVKNLSDLEVRIQSDLRYFEGPVFGEPNEKFLPINPKLIEKIKKFEVKNK